MLSQISCPRGALPDIDAEQDPYPEEYSIQVERELFIDNLLVRIHLIIETIVADRPCAMGV